MLPALRPVHVKPQIFDGTLTGLRFLGNFKPLHARIIGLRKTEQFQSFSIKKDLLRLLQKVPLDSQNTYAELIKALELRYGDKHLREVYYAQLRTRRQRSGESLQEFEGSIDRLIRLAYPEAPEVF